jgi:hypothetical protein
MDTLDKARETQLHNIEVKTGKSRSELRAIVDMSGLKKHSEIRNFLMQELSLGYGDANSLVHFLLASDGQSAAQAMGLLLEDVLAEIYSGKKAGLRPLHDRIFAVAQELGDFETVPKKGYVSLRRKKQFAMLGPATNETIELGLNARSLPEDARLKRMPEKSMCQYTLRLTSDAVIDAQLKNWLEQAFVEAGGP